MKKILFCVVAGFLLLSLGYAPAENLVPNGDFEIESTDTPGTPSGWTYSKRLVEGKHSWITDDVRSGTRAMKIEALKCRTSEKDPIRGGIFIGTTLLSAPPANTVLDVSAWIKAKDVVSPGSYYKLRFTIYFWDKDGKKLRHSDMLCTDGSRDWTKIESTQRVPEGTTAISLSFGLTDCTGTGWIDDVRVTVHSDALTGERVFHEIEKIEGPVIVPCPWQVKTKKGEIAINNLIIKGLNDNPRLQKAMEQWLVKKKLQYRISEDGSVGKTDTLLVSGDSSEKLLVRQMKNCFPGVSWKELGDQGYFLSVSDSGGKNTIYLGANTEQGRFYGLQSLRQLLNNSDGICKLSCLDIVDKPTLNRRGMAMGLQWFGNNSEAIERLVALKCNYIHNQGSFLGLKFCGGLNSGKWRIPFTENELKTLKNYLNLAEENFIEICLSFAPRGGNPMLKYSSDDEINIIVEKMSVLYDAGFRNFGLNFDDLQNIGLDRLTEPEDIEKFDNDLGKAHCYFTSEIYKKLKKKHKDISFCFLPYAYGLVSSMSEAQKNYLKTVGQMPKEIIFVSCATDEKNMAEATRLTGRKHLIWDNYFAGWERGGAPVFVPPLERDSNVSNDNIFGFTFLPMLFRNEDAAMVSWLTAADYMWSPQRYESGKSFNRAVAKAVGGNKNLALLVEYYRYFVSDIHKVTLPTGEELQTLERRKINLPDNSSQERIRVLQDNTNKLLEWKEKLKAVVPEKLFTAIDKEIEGNLKNLELLLMQEKERPFPIKVRQERDGATELTDFYILAAGGKKAQIKTSAYLSHNTENLYIKIICQEPEIKKIKTTEKKRDKNVFQDDCVELFLDTNADRTTYFHIAVNSIGTVYDAANQNRDWNGTYTITPSKGSDFWTLDITIPFKTLGISGVKPGDRWNFNICRERYAGEREFSSYALLLKPGFHAPDSFWTLEFE